MRERFGVTALKPLVGGLTARHPTHPPMECRPSATAAVVAHAAAVTALGPNFSAPTRAVFAP
jgi:hypothetical protein